MLGLRWVDVGCEVGVESQLRQRRRMLGWVGWTLGGVLEIVIEEMLQKVL
jgi:hypothetical protein